MKATKYSIELKNIKSETRFAIVSDLHGISPDSVIEKLKENRPDFILMPGDIFEKLDGNGGKLFDNGIRLLTESAKIAPTFYSIGNHEDGATRSWSPSWKKRIKKRELDVSALNSIKDSGAIMLNDQYAIIDGIAFGGLSSGLINDGGAPNTEWLHQYCALECPKVLLCHHPEYYEKYLKEMPIDLIVSGHAHGGQWRFFGRGVFAPGQGLLPKYTKGVYDNKFVVSTGLKKGKIPRFFNPPEVVIVNVIKK